MMMNAGGGLYDLWTHSTVVVRYRPTALNRLCSPDCNTHCHTQCHIHCHTPLLSQHTATHCHTHCPTHCPTHCHMLPHTATCCHTPPHTVPHTIHCHTHCHIVPHTFLHTAKHRGGCREWGVCFNPIAQRGQRGGGGCLPPSSDLWLYVPWVHCCTPSLCYLMVIRETQIQTLSGWPTIALSAAC